jgi:hypothetical protein
MCARTCGLLDTKEKMLDEFENKIIKGDANR